MINSMDLQRGFYQQIRMCFKPTFAKRREHSGRFEITVKSVIFFFFFLNQKLYKNVRVF